MSIIHKGPLTTVVHADSREYLHDLDRESVDLVVTDPPYGKAWRSNRRAGRFEPMQGDGSVNEGRELLDAVTPGLVAVLRRNRHAYCFGLPLIHHLISATAEVIWNKGAFSGGNLALPYGASHETVYMHYRAADRHNADKGVGALSARLRRGSVISVKRPSARQVNRHPTEKPVDLMRQLIESSSTPGELVLDPFAGSGSTGVAAVIEGRRALLVEVDAGYAEIAAERCRDAEAVMAGVVGL